jgi:hypothetical protein
MAARVVSDELAHLSVESLRHWEAHYGDVVGLATPAPSIGK